jgi:hypothetical protein
MGLERSHDNGFDGLGERCGFTVMPPLDSQ